MIQPVKDRFAAEAPKFVDDMLSIIQDEQEKFAARKPELAKHWIPRSAWKLSIPMPQGVVAAFYDPEARAISGLRPGLAMVTFPPEATGDDRQHVDGMFPDGRFVRPTSDAVHDAISQVLQAVSYLRKMGISVSQEIDVAIHKGNERKILEQFAE
nr:hypothetical protein [Pseudomonas sp. BIGb0427]